MKKIISLFTIILMVLSVASIATTPIEPRTVINPNETMLINETTAVEETENISGDNFILEKDDYTISNQTINGNEFALVAEKCIIENTTINGNLFIMSDTLEMKNVTITGSAFILAKEVKIDNSYLTDIYALGQTISLNEKNIINREVKAIGESIFINSTINGNTYLYGNKVKIQENAVLNGNNEIEYTTEYSKSDNSVINNIELKKLEKTNKELTTKTTVKAELLNWVSILIRTLIVVGLMYLFNYKRFETFIIKNKDGKKLAKISIKGLLWLILIPIFAVILMFISFGLLFGISIILIILYGLYIYIIIPVVSFAIALIVKNKYIQKESKFELLGITLIIASFLWIFTKFPILGGLINFVILILGFGLIMEYTFKYKKIEEENVVVIDKKEE